MPVLLAYSVDLAKWRIATWPTTAMMPELITELKARGYRFVTVSEYMQLVGAKQ